MQERDAIKKPDNMSDEDWNLLAERTASLARIRADARADVEAYLASPDGRAAGSGADPRLPTGLPTLLLTVIGRKSGEKRTTPLIFLQHGADMVVVASLAGYDEHPAWYLNISENPRCWVQVERRKMEARARCATAAERKELWPKLIATFPNWGFFQLQTERVFPVVILSPTSAASA